MPRLRAQHSIFEEAWPYWNDHDSKLDVPIFIRSTSERYFSVCPYCKPRSQRERGLGVPNFGSCSYVLVRSPFGSFNGRFLRLFDKQGSVANNEELVQRFHTNPRFNASSIEFSKIPGSPVAYWLSERLREVFERGTPLGKLVDAKQGLATANNDRFLRRWHEVDHGKCAFDAEGRDAAAQSGKKWFPYNKGGEFRRWFGNHEFLVNWERDGYAIRAFGTERGGRPRSVARNTEYYFQASLTWSDVTSGPVSFRVKDCGSIHDVTGMSAFSFRGVGRRLLAGYCNTPIVLAIARATNPTLHFQIGDFVNIPFIKAVGETLGPDVIKNVARLICTTGVDWDAYERSWDFQFLPILTASSEPEPTLESSCTAWIAQNRKTIAEVKRLEEKNNHLFIDAYGLTKELTPDVAIEHITLTVNPAYRLQRKYQRKKNSGPAFAGTRWLNWFRMVLAA